MVGYPVNKPITRIIYSFKDASVPPQYHRSYTITVTKDQSHIIVDSYGDILVDTMINIPGQTISELARYIEIYRIKGTDHNNDIKSCTGVTSKSLTVYSDTDVLLNGTVYQCSDHLEGNLSGDIDAFAKKLEGLFPDFSNLLK